MTALEKALHQHIRCGDLTQPDNHLCTIIASVSIRPEDQLKPKTMSPRHRLKNPFTMSKKPASAGHIAGRIRQTATLHLWKSVALRLRFGSFAGECPPDIH